MGDRVSIQFKDPDGNLSPVLFSHWRGMEFVDEANRYAGGLSEEVKAKNRGHMYPIDRMEAGTVMVDFIRHITKDEERIESDLYLACTENDGDNSDNGHHVIQLIRSENREPKK